MPKPLKLFYSYSHRDEALKDELMKHLTTLKSNGLVESWHDRQINPGGDWDRIINENLLQSDIILFLISSDFMSSSYCNEVEVKKAMELHEKGVAKCIPIFLREYNFSGTPFAKLQGLPRDGYFVTDKTQWNDLDKPFTLITKELEADIKKIQESKEQETKRSVEITPKSETTDSKEDELIAALKLLLEKKRNLTYTSSADDIKEIRSLQEKFIEEIDIHKTIDNIPALTSKFPIELFNVIYGTETLSKELRGEIENIRSNENYSWYQRSLIVSALTLSVLNFQKVDQYKLLLLIDFVKDQEDKVWQKAITGLTLALIYRKNAWLKYSMVTKKLQSFKEDSVIQSSLTALAFVMDAGLYSIYFPNDLIYKNNFFQENPAHCFLPFYENNEAVNFYLENSSSEDADKEIASINKSPLPDTIKYAICFDLEKNSEEGKDRKKEKVIANYFNYLMSMSSVFEPFLQHLNELYGFLNFYPSVYKEQVFKERISFAETKLKDFVFNEIEKLRLLAMHAMRKNEYETAEKYFRGLLKYQENDMEALFNFAECLRILGKRGDELDERYKIERLAPKNTRNLMSIAKIFSDKGNYNNSIIYSTKAVESEPDEATSYIFRGEVLYNSKKYHEALDDINRALEISPKDPQIYLTRGKINERLKKFEDSLVDFEKSLALKESVEVYANRAQLYYYINKCEEALKDYNKIIELQPTIAEFHINRSYVYGVIKEYRKAFEDINKAIKLEPKNTHFYIKRGVLFGVVRRYEEALQDFNTSITLNPKEGDSYLYQGAIFLKLNQYGKALQNVEKSIELGSKSTHQYRVRAMLFKEIKEPNKALKDFNKVIELEPEEQIGYIYRGSYFIYLKDYDKAFQDFNKAIELNPFDSQSYIHRAIVFKKLKQFEKALDDCNYAYSINNFDNEALFGITSVNRIKNNIEEALDILNKLILTKDQEYQDNDNASYICCLAEIHSSGGDDDQFFHYIELAFKLGLSVEQIEEDVKEKYKNSQQFIELCKKYEVNYSNAL